MRKEQAREKNRQEQRRYEKEQRQKAIKDYPSRPKVDGKP